MIRGHVVSAILWRNLKQYFSGVLGYVIIVAFVTVCSLMTFSQQFFSDNLANLDQLSEWFPFLLLFLAPAITMTAWADERRQGTDAILFTLPASDFEITLGKYLAAAAVYSIALLFSASQLFSIAMLGTPDWGVIAATYLGYWLAGLALLAIGMFASSLTDSPTVAFVLGAMLCAVPVLIGRYFRGQVWLERLGLEWHLQDFLSGLVTIPGVLYFASLVILMLYLNLVVIGHRHWYRGQEVSLGSHFVVRVISLLLALVAANYVVHSWAIGPWSRVDLTSERLYTLDEATLRTLAAARDAKQEITLRAFVSSEVPREYVNAKKNFLNLLRQYDSMGKNLVNVELNLVAPNSDGENDAAAAGIQPRMTRSEVGGRTIEQKVFFGAVISSPSGDVTLPEIERETSLEYELTRGIASAANRDSKITVGIVTTDTHFGGPEFDGRRIPWTYADTMAELEKMYGIQHISQADLPRYVEQQAPPAAPGEAAPPPKAPELKAPGVLLVPDPSSLDASANDALLKYLAAGHPVILLADPLPFYWTTQYPLDIGVLNAPLQPRVPMQSQYSNLLSSSSLPKAEGGTARSLMTALGLNWDAGQTAWNLLNPHPAFGGTWPEYLGPAWPPEYGPFEMAFVYARGGAEEGMTTSHPASSGLSEVLFFYPGSLRPDPEAQDLEFLPMISLGRRSGVVDWSQLTMKRIVEQARPNPRTGEIEVSEQPARSQFTDDDQLILQPKPSSRLDETPRYLAAQVKGKGSRKENAIVICDLDFVSNLAYEQQDALGLPLDNLRLLQNSIEVLAGDQAFVALRNRRPIPRTLRTIETRVNQFREQRTAREREMEDATRLELEKAQSELDQASKSISEDESLNFIQKLQQASQTSMDAQMRFERKQAALNKKLKAELDRLRAEERKATTGLENRWRSIAILLAPLPALLLGLGVFFVRFQNENREVRQRHAAGS